MIICLLSLQSLTAPNPVLPQGTIKNSRPTEFVLICDDILLYHIIPVKYAAIFPDIQQNIVTQVLNKLLAE